MCCPSFCIGMDVERGRFLFLCHAAQEDLCGPHAPMEQQTFESLLRLHGVEMVRFATVAAQHQDAKEMFACSQRLIRLNKAWSRLLYHLTQTGTVWNVSEEEKEYKRTVGLMVEQLTERLITDLVSPKQDTRDFVGKHVAFVDTAAGCKRGTKLLKNALLDYFSSVKHVYDVVKRHGANIQAFYHAGSEAIQTAELLGTQMDLVFWAG